MNPQALDRTDYIKLALKLMDHLDHSALLNQWENEYLEINEKFHPYLLFTIDGLIKDYEQSTPGKGTNQTDKHFSSAPGPEGKIRKLKIKRVVVFDRWLGFNLSHRMKPIIESHVEGYHPYDFSGSANFDLIAFYKELSEEEEGDEGSISLEKMEWLGTQKELAELFIMLKERRWIHQFRHTTIKACFTHSNSIQQVLKPGQEKGKYYDHYPQVFTENYHQKFHGIKENPKSK